jgi:transposase
LLVPIVVAWRCRRSTVSGRSWPVTCSPNSAKRHASARGRQAVRAAGFDPLVDESGDTRRRGRLAKHGAPVLGWALLEAAQHAQRANSPDRGLYTQAATRVGSKRAVLTVARKIGRRADHVLHELETQAA